MTAPSTDIRLYDTAAREKRVFAPANSDRITMYVCGPTVYSRAHIGNFRPEIVFDILRRLLIHQYPDHEIVTARNFTDIDDKIMDRARTEDRTIEDVTAEAEGWYRDDAAALGCLAPTFAPRATETIGEMIAMMEALIARGHAYAAEGHVLFDVASDGDYGRVSHRDLDQMVAGSRVEVAPYKKNAHDFVMWKPSAEGQPGWDSPWGRGRPGWHLECSAMIEKHLGRTIDIHGGGQDLIFPHHENESAQSRCAHDGAPLANFWLHNGFLSFGKDKMSKSVGNVVTVDALLAAGHRGETIRLAMLMAHYRQPLEWTEDLLVQAKATLDRWYRLIEKKPAAEASVDLEFLDALSNDLGTPAALARLSSLARSKDVGALKGSAAILGFNFDAQERVRGPHALGQGQSVRHQQRISGASGENHGADVAAIDSLISERTAAKAARDFATADRIRDELAADGILLEDGPNGTTWRRT
jgi:cysteinyl-tRNA synthetase|tara:strand:+ start:6889 stop:8301 length:1413 start_codon:yes stop_codon:yes gene_type:complete